MAMLVYRSVLPWTTVWFMTISHFHLWISPSLPRFFSLMEGVCLSGLVPLVMEYRQIGSSDIEMMHSRSLTTTHRSYWHYIDKLHSKAKFTNVSYSSQSQFRKHDLNLLPVGSMYDIFTLNLPKKSTIHTDESPLNMPVPMGPASGWTRELSIRGELSRICGIWAIELNASLLLWASRERKDDNTPNGRTCQRHTSAWLYVHIYIYIYI